MVKFEFRFPAWMNDRQKELAEKITLDLQSRLDKIKELEDDSRDIWLIYQGKGIIEYYFNNLPDKYKDCIIKSVSEVLKKNPEVDLLVPTR